MRVGKRHAEQADIFQTKRILPKKEEIMSGRGQGNKSRKRDLIDAQKITSALAKISNKGNLPKKLKADAKKSRLPKPQPLLLLFLPMASSVAVMKVKQRSNKTEQLNPLLKTVV